MGEIIDAQEAFRLGIYNKVYPHDQLREATLEYAQWYAEKGPPLALGATRSLAYMGLQQGLTLGRVHLPVQRRQLFVDVYVGSGHVAALESSALRNNSRARRP